VLSPLLHSAFASFFVALGCHDPLVVCVLKTYWSEELSHWQAYSFSQDARIIPINKAASNCIFMMPRSLFGNSRVRKIKIIGDPLLDKSLKNKKPPNVPEGGFLKLFLVI